MSYEMTVGFRRAPTYALPIALPSHDALLQQLGTDLGELGAAIQLATDVDKLVVAYEGDADHAQLHQSILARLERVLHQLALQAFEAEVDALVRYGLQAAAGGAAGALGLTRNQSAAVKFVAVALGGVAGYALGQMLPIRLPVLRASLEPHYGWVWTEVPRAQPGWQAAS